MIDFCNSKYKLTMLGTYNSYIKIGTSTTHAKGIFILTGEFEYNLDTKNYINEKY